MHTTDRKRQRTAATIAALLLVGVAAGTATATPHTEGPKATAQTTAPAAPSHVFFIMMENHGYQQIIGNTKDAPYINALAARYSVATNFHGVTHPSLPNYLAMLSGSTQGIFDDCRAGATVTCAPAEFTPTTAGTGPTLTPAQTKQAASTPHMFHRSNLVDQLEAKHLTWKAYMQSMPRVGYLGEIAPVKGTNVSLYAQKHNPFMYFADINSPKNPRLNKIVPLQSNLANDLNRGTVPNFVWITPDLCHDMHGISASAAAKIGIPSCGHPTTGIDHGPIKLGDDFLKQTITAITNSKTWRTTNSTIVISWDENDAAGTTGGPGSPTGTNGRVLGGGNAPLLVINSRARQHEVTSQPADHYTVLATLEQLWHLGCLANTCSPSTSGSLLPMFAS